MPRDERCCRGSGGAVVPRMGEGAVDLQVRGAVEGELASGEDGARVGGGLSGRGPRLKHL